VRRSRCPWCVSSPLLCPCGVQCSPAPPRLQRPAPPQPAAQGESGLTGRSTRLLSTAAVDRLPWDRGTGEGEGSGRGGLVVRGSLRACSPINGEVALPAWCSELHHARSYRATVALVSTAAVRASASHRAARASAAGAFVAARRSAATSPAGHSCCCRCSTAGSTVPASLLARTIFCLRNIVPLLVLGVTVIVPVEYMYVLRLSEKQNRHYWLKNLKQLPHFLRI
jgi:hypothetical protein